MVARESVEVQVRVCVSESCVRLDTAGVAEEMNNVMYHRAIWYILKLLCVLMRKARNTYVHIESSIVKKSKSQQSVTLTCFHYPKTMYSHT